MSEQSATQVAGSGRGRRVQGAARLPILVTVTLLAAAPSAPGQDGEARPEGDRVLRVATKESPPFAFRDKGGKWTGISIELWTQLAKELGLRYEFVELPLDEMFAALAGSRVDVAIAAISVTPERERRVDFSHPYYTTGLGVVTKRRSQRGFWLTLRRVFSTAFFAIVLGLAGLTVLAGFLFSLFEHRSAPDRFNPRTRRGLRDGIWWSIVILLGHKGLTPATTPARILAATGMIASLLALSTLTGAIASILTLGQLEGLIEHPDDLRRVRVATVEDSTSAEYLRAARINFASAPDLEQALSRVLAEGGADAVLYDAAMLKYVLRSSGRARFGRALEVLPWTFQEQDYAIALAPESALREPLNRALLTLRGSGAWKDLVYRFLGE